MVGRSLNVGIALTLLVCVLLIAAGCDEAKAGRYQVITQAPGPTQPGAVFLLDTATGQSWVWQGGGWQQTGLVPAQQ